MSQKNIGNEARGTGKRGSRERERERAKRTNATHQDTNQTRKQKTITISQKKISKALLGDHNHTHAYIYYK